MDLIPRGYGFDDFFSFFLPDKTFEKIEMKCDIFEKDGKYNLIVDIPGMNKEDVKIECEDGYLYITAIKEDKKDEEDKNYIRRERHFGKYQRSFYVGDIDPESIEAEFKDGSLTIMFPKEENKPNKKQIEIK